MVPFPSNTDADSCQFGSTKDWLKMSSLSRVVLLIDNGNASHAFTSDSKIRLHGKIESRKMPRLNSNPVGQQEQTPLSEMFEKNN